MDAYVPYREASKHIKASNKAFGRWADNGIIDSIRTPGGTRLYNVWSYIHGKPPKPSVEKRGICYCRVSSHGQKDDLQRQCNYMAERFPDHDLVTDVGSGINFKRKGLQRILERYFKGNVSQVVVAHKDRLCRFAFELLQWVLQAHDVDLLVLDKTMEDPEQELAQDLLSITHVFSCRINGKRKYRRTEDKENQNPCWGPGRSNLEDLDGQLQSPAQSAGREAEQQGNTAGEEDQLHMAEESLCDRSQEQRGEKDAVDTADPKARARSGRKRICSKRKDPPGGA